MSRHLACLATFFGLVVLSSTAPALAQHDHSGSAAPAAESPPPLYDNLGDLHHAVTTSNPEAQKYFDQGLRLVFAFNHNEAIRAFKEAARLDSTCAMAYWGVALAMGPNINVPMDPATEPTAYDFTRRALIHARQASEPDRRYIEALAKRYAPQGSADRSARDLAYANAMRALAKRFPNDPDASVLFAEAMMDLRPWNLYSLSYKPAPGTLEIVATLERVLRKHPNHPGAIHYYIHAVEASGRPERAIPYAGRLPKLTPGAGHLVHMPTHLYRLVGRWRDCEELNERAAKVDDHYVEEQKVTGVYPLMYRNHNVHFVAFSAAMQGESAEAIRAARDIYDHVPSEVVQQMPMAELFTPWPLLVLVRFGRWDDIFKEPEPPAHYRYTRAIWHYARGMAFAATGELDKSAVERDSVAEAGKTFPPDIPIGLNSGPALLHLAATALSGEIAARGHQIPEAIGKLREAVQLEDSLHYDEPPTWYYPVRHSLGAVLLEAKRPAEAEAVYRADLRRNPNNGWALFGLWQALEARGAKREAEATKERFKKAWAHADVELRASRF